MLPADVAILVDMGFTLARAEKALQVTGNKGFEPAMEWLLAHPEDFVTDTVTPAPNESLDNSTVQETTEEPNMSVNNTADDSDKEAKSLKCDVCNKLFRSSLEVEYHATKSGHDSFSESLEEKKPLTDEEKKEKLQLLEEKLKQKRREREENEKKEEYEKEKLRIKSGKEMAEARKKLADLEMKKILEQRKREKEEDMAARKAVREKIEADKIARRMKYQPDKVPEPPTVVPTPTPAPVAAPKQDYSETKLAIRLTNGHMLTQTFGVGEQLSAVRLFVQINRSDTPGPFDLMTSFPRKLFSDEDYETPLEHLGLVPSAVIIVQKKIE